MTTPVSQRGKLRLREAQRLAGGDSGRWGRTPICAPTTGSPIPKDRVSGRHETPHCRRGTFTSRWPLPGCEPASPRPGVPGEVDRGLSDATLPQFPLRAAHSRRPADRADSRPRPASPYGPWSPGSSQSRTPTPSPPGSALGVDPPSPPPPLTSQAAERRPSDGCACAPRRCPAPPPAAAPAQKEPAPVGFYSAQARARARRAWGEVTSFGGGGEPVVRATDLCDRMEAGNQD